MILLCIAAMASRVAPLCSQSLLDPVGRIYEALHELQDQEYHHAFTSQHRLYFASIFFENVVVSFNDLSPQLTMLIVGCEFVPCSPISWPPIGKKLSAGAMWFQS